jgi:hypothetical protein
VAANESETAVTPQIDIYAVGLLKDIQRFIHEPDRQRARQQAAYAGRLLVGRVRRREWRPLRSYLLNGYLAEPREIPVGFTRCGTGWTRGRAFRDMQRRLAQTDR